MSDPVQQCDVGAEKQVLGSVLLKPDQMVDVAAVLHAGDFYRPAHETIWRACVSQQEASEPVDPKLVAERLKGDGDLGRVGGAPYLFDLVNGCLTPANATHYAEIVARYAGLRRIVDAGSRITQMAAGAAGADLEEVRERSRSFIESATDTRRRMGGWAYEQIPETLYTLESEPARLLPTPWPGLDDHVGGWAPGRLYTVGARPGVGKTVVGVQAAVDMARRGMAAAYVTLEMSAEEIHMRMISQIARVPYTRLERREMHEHDWGNVQAASGRLSELAVHVLDSAHVRPVDVWHHARTLARRRPLGLLVVDYLQLMSSPDTRRARHEVVADFSRQLKVMARDLGVPVLACSQLNRASEGRRDRRPNLSDLRETGAIEQDSDVVVLLHRDTTDDVHQEDMELIVAKNRHGSTGTVRARFYGRYQQVEQVAWTPHDVLDDPRVSTG